MYFLCEIRLC
uniref:ZP domain-containing protein n=1 Tax=Anguilla anguilla TaxID=7936 RepID=A0A0E9U803_ANGAN